MLDWLALINNIRWISSISYRMRFVNFAIAFAEDDPDGLRSFRVQVQSAESEKVKQLRPGDDQKISFQRQWALRSFQRSFDVYLIVERCNLEFCGIREIVRVEIFVFRTLVQWHCSGPVRKRALQTSWNRNQTAYCCQPNGSIHKRREISNNSYNVVWEKIKH